MEVHNINGMSDNRCRCGSWKAHWEKYNERHCRWPQYCSESCCFESATVGAHVQKESGADRWYIIPLCQKHNNCFGESIDVGDDISFAIANRSETCGY